MKHSRKLGLVIYRHVLSIRIHPFSYSRNFPKAFHKVLSLSQRTDRMNDSHKMNRDHNSTKNHMSHACCGAIPRQTNMMEVEFWQNVIHRSREWQTSSVICLENAMNSKEKAQKIDIEKMNPKKKCRCPNSGTEKSRKYTKWRYYPVVDRSGDGMLQNNIAWEHGMLCT